MKGDIALLLVDELGRHTRIQVPERVRFVKALMETDIPEYAFSVKLPSNQQIVPVDGQSRYHHMSLRRVLRNRDASEYHLNPLQRVLEFLASNYASYSSDSLSRRLRSNRDMLDIMARSDQEFSLLGKLRTYDFGNPDEDMFVQTKPILVVPGASQEDVTRISLWEESNATYGKEIGFPPLVITKKISPKEFQSMSDASVRDVYPV